LNAVDEYFIRVVEPKFELDMEWARKKGGKLGKELEQEALEFKQKELDTMYRAQEQLELDRLRRYRKFLERERCPLFLKEYGTYQAIVLRLDDDDDEGEYDDSSEGESDESDGEDESYYCEGGEVDNKSGDGSNDRWMRR
jgi:hypothetical protein